MLRLSCSWLNPQHLGQCLTLTWHFLFFVIKKRRQKEQGTEREGRIIHGWGFSGSVCLNCRGKVVEDIGKRVVEVITIQSKRGNEDRTH